MSGQQSATPLELQGYFPDIGSLQTAMNRLADAGFTRADLSPPEEHPHFGEKSESDEKNDKTSETDQAQLRTLGTGMAGYAGAAAVAGATIATGGAAAVAVAAAAAVGAGSAALAASVGQAADTTIAEHRNQMANEGRLVLGVRTITADEVTQATRIMKEAGATHVEHIATVADATTAGIASASWTG